MSDQASKRREPPTRAPMQATDASHRPVRPAGRDVAGRAAASARITRSRSTARRSRGLFEAAQAAPSWCNVAAVARRGDRAAGPPPRWPPRSPRRLARASSAPTCPSPAEYPSPHREHRAACAHAQYPRDRHSRATTGPPATTPGCATSASSMRRTSRSCPATGRLGAYAYLDVGVWLGYMLTGRGDAGHRYLPDGNRSRAYPRPLRAPPCRSPNTDVILLGLALGRGRRRRPGERLHHGRASRSPRTSCSQPEPPERRRDFSPRQSRFTASPRSPADRSCWSTGHRGAG